MSMNNGYVIDYEVLAKIAKLPSLKELESHESSNDFWEISIEDNDYCGSHRIFKAEGIVEGDLEEGHWYIVFEDEQLYETRPTSLGDVLAANDAFPDELIWQDDVD